MQLGKITFLDLKVKLMYRKLETDLYMKATDLHQYLHYLSSQSRHIKGSIVYTKSSIVKLYVSKGYVL